MDGKRFKPDSNFLLKKCSRRRDGGIDGVDRVGELPYEIGVDRISELPDDIVLSILSFLSLRGSVTTSVLSSRWSNLWKHTPNLKFDRISQLPDEIIIFILSFLSSKEAAATSVLSSRWSDLWRCTPNLNFNNKLFKINHYEMPIIGSRWDVEGCKYIETVNSVLQSHKAPSLKEFRISLYVNKSAQCTVTKWLKFVFSRKVENLELDLLCEETMYMVALEESLRDSQVCLPQNLIGFKSIKRLCLKCFRVSGEAIDTFLRNCPLLEQLYIHDGVLTSDVVVCGPTLALKHFDIYCCTGKYSVDGYSIKVSAPNLTWLRIDATSQKLLLENIPKLTTADYTCISPCPDYAKHFASAVFSCISRLEILNLSLLHPKLFFMNGCPQMPKLKKLAIRYNGVFEHSLLPVTALIKASPRLQEFEFEFVNMPRDSTTWKKGITNVKRRWHRHLKVFKFTGFLVCASHHMELLTYIIDNCVALKKIIIGSSSVYGDQYNMDPRAVHVCVEQLLREKVPDHIQLHL